MTTHFERIAFLSLFVLGTFQIHAQTPQVPVTQMVNLRSVEAEVIASPQYSGDVRAMSIKRDGRLDWLMVKTVFETSLKWTDEITFTFYVVLKGEAENLPEGAKEVNLFSGTATIVNVPQTREGELTMFLDPYTLARYGEPTHVAVVVNINGQPAAGMAEPSSSEASQWWTRETPNETPLLTRDETPYVLIEIDKQNTIKP